MKYALYINGNEVDLDASVTFPITFQYQDLTNPVAVLNSLSKTITLPATSRNSHLFNHIWRLDHNVLNFKASQRTPFVLTWNGTIVESGYLKFNETVFTGLIPTGYNVTLYGGLFDFFYEISTKYLEELNVPPENYSHTINAEAVVNSWNNEFYKYALTYHGLYDNFNSNEVDGRSNYDNYQSVAYVENLGLFIAVGNNLLGLSGNGTNFSSYPFEGDWKDITSAYGETGAVAVGDNLIKITSDGSYWYEPDNYPKYNYRAVTSDGGGVYLAGDGIIAYSITASFNIWNTDPYDWQTIVINNGMLVVAGYSKATGDTYIGYNSGTVGSAFTYVRLRDVMVSGSVEVPEKAFNINRLVTVNSYYFLLTEEGYFLATTMDRWSYTTHPRDFHGIAKSEDMWVVVGHNFIGYNNVPGSYTFIESDYAYNDVIYANGMFVAVGPGVTASSEDGINWNERAGSFESIPELDEHQRNEFRSYYQTPMLRVRPLIEQIIQDSSYLVELDETFFNEDNPYWNNLWVSMDRLKMESPPIKNSGNIRSGDSVEFSTMIKSGVSQYHFFINYCELFGLLFEKDKLHKFIRVKTRNTFFSEYKIIDWTSKVDNRSNKITPLLFNYRYGVFSWQENESYYEKYYREKYNREYGVTRADTHYAFNDNEKEYLPNLIFINAVMSSEFDRYFKGRSEINPYQDDKILPAFFDKDNNTRKSINSAMAFFFFGGMQEGLTPFRITDDTEEMKETFNFSWTDEETETFDTCPLFTRLLKSTDESPGYSLDFGRPRETFYQLTSDNEYKEEAALYYKFWDTYINELLSENCKIFTAYLNLTPIDISHFSFNTFVKIQDTLWHVNQIIDYNVAGLSSTKVELIRVLDIESYTTGKKL